MTLKGRLRSFFYFKRQFHVRAETPAVSVGLPMPIISNENQRPKARVINFSLTINGLLISPHDNILLYNLYDNPVGGRMVISQMVI